jgi:hypothetical protein
MNHICAAALIISLSAVISFAQGDSPTYKAEVRSAFVWGEDSPGGAISSSIRDPLTAASIPKLTYAGIEVTSHMGFERIGHGQAGTFLGCTTMIVNGTEQAISVQWGGISVDGHQVPLLSVPADHNSVHQSNSRHDLLQVSNLSCFRSSFLSSDNLFQEGTALKHFTLDPRRSLSVSSAVRDPRSYSVRCSIEGCHPIGIVRYSVRVNNQDFVFVWDGRSIVYCGK